MKLSKQEARVFPFFKKYDILFLPIYRAVYEPITFRLRGNTATTTPPHCSNFFSVYQKYPFNTAMKLMERHREI